LFVLLISLPPARAQSVAEAEKQAYCQYVQDQAAAQRTLDTGVQVYGQLGQSSNNTTKQAVVGLQESLSRNLQGISATRIGVLECTLYRATVDVDRATKYRLAAIAQRVGTQRVKGLGNSGALKVLNEEIAATQKRMGAGDATLADLMALTDRRATVMTQLRAAQNDAIQPVPDLPDVNLDQAMVRIDQATLALQKELNHQQTLQTWDLALIGGVQKPLADMPAGTSTGMQPFVGLTVSYNLSAQAYRRKLDNATASLMALRRQQNDQLYQRVSMLKKTLADNLKMAQDSLPVLTDEFNRLSATYARLQKLDTPESVRMRTQIRVSLALAKAELDATRTQITLLSDYHAQNQ
ncbi:MAG: hypothetical protein LBH31_06025, partial [Burkholderiaceae bacterium]|jgi:hypothetical protein|nr:hypothetical protein [Burkholderiaceae bacterium]